MPEIDRQAALAEAYRRNILPPDLRSAYEEAVRRGLVEAPQFYAEAREPSWSDRAAAAITGAGRKVPGVGEFTTEFSEDIPNPMRTAAGMLMSGSEGQMADVLRKQVPGVEFSKDPSGNLMVRIPGREKWEYLNRPGLSPRDISNTVAQGAMFLRGAQGVGAAMPRASLPARAIGTGAAAGGTQMGMDLAAGALGGKPAVDLPKAGAVAAGGALFELSAPAVGAIWRAMTSVTRGRPPTVQEAKIVLSKLGFDAQALTDEAVAKFIDLSRRSASPEAAAGLAEASSLPVPVPLKRGQITGSAKDQMFEDLAEKGAYGEGAESIMRGASQRTEDAIRQNIPAIQERIGGGIVGGRDQGARLAQQALVDQAAGMKNAVQQAYDSARGTSAGIRNFTVRGLAKDLEVANSDFVPFAPKAQELLERLQTMAEGEGPSNVIVKNLFDWRRTASTLANNVSDKTEQAALRGMVRTFDERLKDIVKQGLIAGDEKAVELWSKAIAARREYGKIFESGDLVSALVETEFKGGANRLAVAPEAAGNAIFGASNTGIISKPQLARELRRMRELLGPDSQAWKAIKEDTFLRLAAEGEAGAFMGGRQTFSGVKIKKAVDGMKERNPEVWGTLFNSNESALISQWANVAARATNPVKGGANWSNTAVGLSNIVQKLGESLFIGPKGRALLSRVWPTAYEGIIMGPAAAAARGGIPARQLPFGMVGGTGAAGMSQYEGNF